MSVVFTNGCFDILHKGHILLLKFCRENYPNFKVVVGVNSDESVKRLKGANRPVNCEKDRKVMLESIKYVDEVFVFDEDTPYNLIVKINPTVIVKGGDYKVSEVVGNDICHVEIFNYVEGYSTTKILQDSSSR